MVPNDLKNGYSVVTYGNRNKKIPVEYPVFNGRIYRPAGRALKLSDYDDEFNYHKVIKKKGKIVGELASSYLYKIVAVYDNNHNLLYKENI